MGSKESDKTEQLTLSLSERRMGCRHCALCVSWVSGPWEEEHQAQGLGAQCSEFTTMSTLGILLIGWIPVTFLLIRDRTLEETSGLRSSGSPWYTPTLEIRAVSLKLRFKKAYSSADLYARENSICRTYTSHLLLKIIVSYIAVEAIDCFHVFQSQFKVKHLKRRKNHINLSPKEPASPWGLEDFPAGWGQLEGKGKPCLSSVRQRMTFMKDMP